MQEPLLLNFDEQVYSVETIQKACYRSTNAFVTDITVNAGKIACIINPVIGATDAGFAHAIQEFKKDVLDQQLRQKIKSETEDVRNLILGLAFSNTSLLNGE
ncbi:MAG: His-Xaa-Ser system protein HxsD [Candidatus Nitrotoga sp.]